MVLKMFSVHDAKANYFGQPFFDQGEASAVRSFGDAVNDPAPTNQWNKHPEDFQLFVVGEFDNLTGEVIPCIPRALVMATSMHRGNLAPAEARALSIS